MEKMQDWFDLYKVSLLFLKISFANMQYKSAIIHVYRFLNKTKAMKMQLKKSKWQRNQLK